MITSAQETKVYFKNLNAIRFFAAFIVIIHHVEQFKMLFGLPNKWNNPVIEIIGKLGVIMFFVLSGFLISYLLFKEKEVTRTINIKHFYIRRLLKIWPLYFLIVALAFFVLPHFGVLSIPSVQQQIGDNFLVKLLLYVFFLPNLAARLFSAIPYVSHVWSIGVEEQFYLIWPGLNKKINNRWMLMGGVIAAYLIIKVALRFAPSSATFNIIRSFWESTPIDCMAIGGLFSLILYERSTFAMSVTSILFNKATQWIVLVATTCLILMAVKIPFIHYEFYAVLFGIIIVNFAANEDRIFSMENTLTNYLGKISYGIYMYHPLAIVIAVQTVTAAGVTNNYLLYPLAIILTIITASASFEFFEKRFIDMKTKYSKIKSGNEAR